MRTLEAFCAKQSIERIDLLKIDAEGSDIAVLQGARGMLPQGAITFAYIEFKNCLRRFPFSLLPDTPIIS